ncbi:segregation and condensation protein A [Spirochaetia bacterium]|nr:segregation and condensation protein A [Spirochaetia bacterium]
MDTVNTARRFRVNEFEGPLDLLLFLIKKNEVNIYDIPIAQITEQYLAYLSYATELDLEDLTEFHSLAASLLYIKSRMLLPVEVNLDDDIEDPRQELVEKLIEYQKFKKLSELMEEKEKEAEWVVERKKLQRPLPFTEEELWEKVDIWDLLKTFSSIMKNLSDERIIDLYEEVSVNEKITLLTELLETRGECNFTDLVVRNGSVLDIICAFLAILEAVKVRMISIFQNRMFGDILIRPNAPAVDGENEASANVPVVENGTPAESEIPGK